MLAFDLFEIQFPYLTNGGLYWAKILAERQDKTTLFHVFPVNIIDFYRFDLIYEADGSWQTDSDYIKQKEFYGSVCIAIEAHMNASLLRG